MLKYIVAVLALAAPAFAQVPQSAPLEQRIGAQIGALVIQNAGLQMQLEQTQEALKAAQARVNTLENKYEPKKPEEKK